MEQSLILLEKNISKKLSQSSRKISQGDDNNLDEEKDPSSSPSNRKAFFSLRKAEIALDTSDANIRSKKKKLEGSSNAIKTFCRIRPTDSKNEIYRLKENENSVLLVNMDQNTLRKFNGVSFFTFSKIFDENSNQADVFNETCLSLIQDLIIKKKSGLIFTYGMTNAGKTFTVVGTPSQPGVLPQTLTYLYKKIENGEYGINNFKVFCNFLEIYNEEVFDLLATDLKNTKYKKKVLIKEKEKRFFVQDPTYFEINTLDDFNMVLNKGINKKVQSSNNINVNSSRSHTIFKIILKNSSILEEEITLSIVDLAGSERANRTEAQGKDLLEACKINQSLSVLGKCMEALKHNSLYAVKKIVPFRESKLTMLFQEYFTSNQNIIMITNINPRKEDFEETMRALNYSCIAKEIRQQKPKIVINPLKKQIKIEEDHNSNLDQALIAEKEINQLNDSNHNTENRKVFLRNELDGCLTQNEISLLRQEIEKLKVQMSYSYFKAYPPSLNNLNLRNEIQFEGHLKNSINCEMFNHEQLNPFISNENKKSQRTENYNSLDDIFSNSRQFPINILNPFVPQLYVPINSFMNQSIVASNINNFKEKFNQKKEIDARNNTLFDENKTNINNFKLEDVKANDLENPNIDLKIPSKITSLNLVFINSELNDFNIGHKKRQYKKKRTTESPENDFLITGNIKLKNDTNNKEKKDKKKNRDKKGNGKNGKKINSRNNKSDKRNKQINRQMLNDKGDRMQVKDCIDDKDSEISLESFFVEE